MVFCFVPSVQNLSHQKKPCSNPTEMPVLCKYAYVLPTFTWARTAPAGIFRMNLPGTRAVTTALVARPSFQSRSMEAPPRTHSTEVAGSPAIRQGGKQMDKALMTLQQHFADSRRATVVAINLERRMRTEQIRESAATMTSRRSIDSRMQQTLEEFPSTVSVTQTSPEVYLPSTAPTGTLISTTVQGHPAGFGKLGVDSGEIRFPGCRP